MSVSHSTPPLGTICRSVGCANVTAFSYWAHPYLYVIQVCGNPVGLEESVQPIDSASPFWMSDDNKAVCDITIKTLKKCSYCWKLLLNLRFIKVKVGIESILIKLLIEESSFKVPFFMKNELLSIMPSSQKVLKSITLTAFRKYDANDTTIIGNQQWLFRNKPLMTVIYIKFHL